MKKQIIETCILLLVLFSIIYIGNIWWNKEKQDLRHNYCYTIGKTTGGHFLYNRGWSVYYEYYFNNEKFETETTIGGQSNKNIKEVNGYYLVKVSIKSPDVNEIHFNSEVTLNDLRMYYKPICNCDSLIAN